MSDVRRACEALGDDPVTKAAFLRALLRYPGWLVPASVSAGGAALVGARQLDGSICLEVYSERAILENEINGPKHAKLPTKLLTTGVVWASLVGDGLAGVVIDPGAPWSRRFAGPEIALLRRWAHTLVLEDGIPVVTESLARHEAAKRHETYVSVPAVLRALVDYPRYRVLRRRDGDHPFARVCPSRAHDDGPPFVAAFTADDCAERYRAALDTPDAWSIVERPGRALFRELVDRDERGLALNTAGPAPTVALWASSLRTLLELEGHDEAPDGSAPAATARPTHSLAAAFASPRAKPHPLPSIPLESGTSTASGPTYRLPDGDRRWLATMFAEPFTADLLEDRDAFARDWQIVDREEPRDPREPHRIILRHTSFAYLEVDLESRGGPSPSSCATSSSKAKKRVYATSITAFASAISTDCVVSSSRAPRPRRRSAKPSDRVHARRPCKPRSPAEMGAPSASTASWTGASSSCGPHPATRSSSFATSRERPRSRSSRSCMRASCPRADRQPVRPRASGHPARGW